MLEALFLMSFLAGDEEAAKEALKTFNQNYAGKPAASRAAAVTDLARTQHEKTLARIGPLVGGEETPVKIAAATGLGNFTEYKKKALEYLTAGLGPNAKEPMVLKAIYEALGKLGDENALPAVHRAFDDKDSVVVKAALTAAGDLKKAASVEPIIELMKKYEKYEKNSDKNKGGGGAGFAGVPYGGGGEDPNRKLAKDCLPACIKALQAITKEKWTTSQEWVIWWGKHKAEYSQPGGGNK